MTPIQFEKQIRLQEARALLIAGPAHVAEIGYLVGYESPSQFGREYRRAFGTPPVGTPHSCRRWGETALNGCDHAFDRAPAVRWGRQGIIGA